MSKRNRARSQAKGQRSQQTQKDIGAFPNLGAYAYSHTVPYWGLVDADLGRDDWGRAEAYKLVGTVNRCVDLLSQAINDLDWNIIRDSDGAEEIVSSSEDRRPRHPAAQAIHDVFADQGTPLFSLWTNSRYLYGETYIEKRVNVFEGGRRQLTWLYPYWCEPETATGRITGYRYGDKNGTAYEFLHPDRVAFDRTHNPTDGLRGLSKIDTALPDINGGREIKRFIKWTLANNARPGLIASPKYNPQDAVPTMFSDQQVDMLQRTLSDGHIGTRNANTAIVMRSAFDFVTLEGPELDKYRALMEEFKKDICITFGVPLAMAGDSSSTTFKDGSEVKDAFYINTVIPLAHLIQDFFNVKLMPFLDPDGDCTFQFDTAEFEDSTTADKAVADLISVQLQGGYLTLNEARVAQGLDALPELEGRVMIGGVPTLLSDLAAPVPPTITAPQMPQLSAGAPVAPSDSTKEASGVSVILSLANNVDLISLQRNLQAKFTQEGMTWTAPDSFHITLVSAPAVDDAQLDQLAAQIRTLPAPEMQLNIGSLASFDSLTEHALHFRIRRNADLEAYQEDVHALCESLGIQTGQYSLPQNWKPHITMGHAAQRIPVVTFQSALRVSPCEVQVSVKRDGTYEIVERVPCGAEPVKHVHACDFPKPLPVAEWRGKALKELRDWQWRIRHGKTKFTPVHTHHLFEAFTAYDALATPTPEFFDYAFAAVRHEPFKATLARVERVFDPAFKSFEDTRQEFEDEFLLSIADTKDGALSPSQLKSALETVIRTLGERAYRDGLEDGGIADAELDEDDIATIGRLRNEAENYLAEFIATFDTLTDAQLDQKPVLWANKSLQPFYDHGLAAADANGLYVWRLGKTEVHCRTCLAMNGTRKRMKRWLADGILPQSDKLECGGWHCDCGLENVRGGARG